MYQCSRSESLRSVRYVFGSPGSAFVSVIRGTDPRIRILPKFHGSATLEPGKETTFDLQYVVSQIIMIECSGVTQGPRQLPVCGAGEQSGPGQ